MNKAFKNVTLLMQDMKPAMSYDGSDFTLWQKNARAKLSELLGMKSFTKVEADFKIEFSKEIDWAKEIRFTYQTEEGYRVPCHLFLPLNAKKSPLMIALQGHSKGMHISMGRTKYEGETVGGDRDFCVRAVKEGFAAIALEQRGFGECGGDKDGPCCEKSNYPNFFLGRTTIGERVWDIMRLIDVLEDNFSDVVNLDNICCMGNSGGGTATAYVAALEDRIKLAMPSCGLCTYKDSIGAMQHCTCNYVPHIAEYFDMDDIIKMAYPKYYIQVNGAEDNIFPLFGAKEVFEKAQKVYADNGFGDRIVHVVGDGGHRFFADDSWPYVHKFIK